MIKFFNSETELPATTEGDFIIYIPCGITEEKQLLETLSLELRFPYYFSFNWDSCEECLSDLEWIKQAKVNICHHDIPLISNPQRAQIYLDIINNPLRLNDSKLQCWFPEKQREVIEGILKDINDEHNN